MICFETDWGYQITTFIKLNLRSFLKYMSFQIFGFNAATSCNCHFFLLPQTPFILRGQDVSGELHHLESRAAVEVKQLNLWILIFWKLQAVK